MQLPEGPELAVDDYCFACGQANPKGLHLTFGFEGDDYVTSFVLDREYQGWHGIAHGGIVATVLDEVMTRLLWERGISVVTAELTVRLKRPVPVGQAVTVRGRQVAHRKRVYETEAEVRLADGTVAATGYARFLQVRDAGEAEAG